jgi:hypothetical protein
MAWTAPRTWVAGEIVTASIMNSAVRDNLRYLKGLDGVPTIESGLTIDNTDGDERLLLPLLSTAECTTVLDAEGEVAFDEQTHQMKEYDGTAVRALISEADVDDTPVNGATTVPVSSNWAYDFQQALTTAGDLPYASGAGVWTRLGVGTIGHILSVAAGGNAPEWRAETARTNKLGTETRDMTAGSGDVAYTGYGFQPTSLIIAAGGGDQGGTSIGLGDVNLAEGCFFITGAGGVNVTNKMVYMLSGGSADQTAVLKTLDADGFTLTWTKVGSPTGTATLYVLALR